MRWQQTGQWYKITVHQTNIGYVIPWFRSTEQLYGFMQHRQGVGCSFHPEPPILTIRDSTRGDNVKLLMEPRPSTANEEKEYDYAQI